MNNKDLANKLVSSLVAVSVWSMILWFCISFGGLAGLIFIPIFGVWAILPCYIINSTVKKLENKEAIITALIINAIIGALGCTVYYQGIVHPYALNAVMFITVPIFQLVLVFFSLFIIKHTEEKNN